MIRIRLHVPGFVDVDEDFRYNYEAETWDELVRTERLSGWASDPQFDHWAVSDGTHLMAEMRPRNGRRHFWVIAHVLEGADKLPLPRWEAPRNEPPEPVGVPDPQLVANLRRQAASVATSMGAGIDRYLRAHG